VRSLVVLGLVALAGAAGPPRNGLLVFAVDWEGSRSNLYVAAPNGSHLHALTRRNDWNGNPAWSPDGKHVIFASSRYGGSTGEGDLFVMDAHGKHLHELTFNGGDGEPALSPDGRRIAFSHGATVDVMNANGTDVHQIVSGANGQASSPSWSPDGARIAFVRFAPTTSTVASIWTVASDGTDPRQLTPTGSYDDWNPSWSPDGTKIAFASNRSGDWEIWVVSVDGSDPRNLTNHPADDIQPAWSPDGRRIAFVSDRAMKAHADVYVMNADGSHVVRVTRHLGPNFGQRGAWNPRWQPLP
jgi:Tol biopolymer transport system component